jgi:hypothetical protein
MLFRLALARVSTSISPSWTSSSTFVPFVPVAKEEAGVSTNADAIFTLSYLFADGSAPSCMDTADANDDGAIDIADAIFVLQYLFVEGPVIPQPYPGCGIDPTMDELGCESCPTCGL